MRLVVVGASGVLGSSLVPYLRGRGLDVLSHAHHMEADLGGDLTDSRQLAELMDRARPDVIINLAALTSVDECQCRPQDAYGTNVHIVENIAAWTRERGSGCFLVQVSTDHVYDGPGPHAESNVTLRNIYAFSKYAGELAAGSVPSTVLRTNFVGRSHRAGRSSLSDWLVQSLVRAEPITVFTDVTFSPLSITRLVELIELVSMRRIRGVFNVGSRGAVSKADFAFALAETLGLSHAMLKRGRADAVHGKVPRPSDMSMDSTLFEETFRVQLPTIREVIESMRDAYAHQG